MSSHIRSKPPMNAMSLTDSTGSDGLESVAIHVLHVLTTSGLLISEDITLCQTLIDSQLDSDITSSPQNSLTFNTNKTVLAVIPLAGALVWFESTLESTYRPVFVSLVGITSWKLLSLLYHYLYKTYSLKRFMTKTQVLCESLRKENNLLKNYLKLIEDNEAVMETTSCGQQYSRRIVDMKDTYRRMCWKCFTRFRDETIGLRQTFPVMSDIDEDVNFLCCLSVDSFARFTTDDESVITLSLLKSLKQLKRLQKSEFFRRIVCIFITICVDKELAKSKSQEVYNQRVFSEITPLFDELIRESEQTYCELLSVYKCAKSLWTSSEVSLIKCRDLRQTVESIETVNLLNANRNIRKHLLIALNIVDECDSLVDEDSVERSDDFRHQLSLKVDSIGAEVKNLDNLVINLEKMLRIEELKKSKQKSFNEMEVKGEESVKPLMTLSTVEDYVVRDQVFEAFVTQECHEIDVEVNAEEEQLWEFTRKVTQDSTNLFRELKVALKSKAVEHELREAKALGIELQVNPMNDNINKEEDMVTAAEDPISDDNTSQTLPKQSFYEQNIVSTELSTESDWTLSPHKCRPELNAFSLSSFESNIASFAAQKAKDFGLSEGTECFGDDSDSEG